MSDTPEDDPNEFGLPGDDGTPDIEMPSADEIGLEENAQSEADIAATLDAMIGGAGGEDVDSGGFGAYTNMSALGQVPVEVQVVLGRAKLPIGNILKLGRGAVVEIDRRVGEQVEIHINHRPVARGEIVIVDDDRLGVTLTEIINNTQNLH